MSTGAARTDLKGVPVVVPPDQPAGAPVQPPVVPREDQTVPPLQPLAVEKATAESAGAGGSFGQRRASVLALRTAPNVALPKLGADTDLKFVPNPVPAGVTASTVTVAPPTKYNVSPDDPERALSQLALAIGAVLANSRGTLGATDPESPSRDLVDAHHGNGAKQSAQGSVGDGDYGRVAINRFFADVDVSRLPKYIELQHPRTVGSNRLGNYLTGIGWTLRHPLTAFVQRVLGINDPKAASVLAIQGALASLNKEGYFNDPSGKSTFDVRNFNWTIDGPLAWRNLRISVKSA